jgi:hypothetical protein
LINVGAKGWTLLGLLFLLLYIFIYLRSSMLYSQQLWLLALAHLWGTNPWMAMGGYAWLLIVGVNVSWLLNDQRDPWWNAWWLLHGSTLIYGQRVAPIPELEWFLYGLQNSIGLVGLQYSTHLLAHCAPSQPDKLERYPIGLDTVKNAINESEHSNILIHWRQFVNRSPDQFEFIEPRDHYRVMGGCAVVTGLCVLWIGCNPMRFTLVTGVELLLSTVTGLQMMRTQRMTYPQLVQNIQRVWVVHSFCLWFTVHYTIRPESLQFDIG